MGDIQSLISSQAWACLQGEFDFYFLAAMELYIQPVNQDLFKTFHMWTIVSLLER